MAFLELSHLRKEFGSAVAVHEFQLEVEQGNFVSLLGPSGCGKTTVLRMVAGFEKPTSGQIVVQGRDITNLPPNRRTMGMVFQNYALFPHMTAVENVSYGLRVAGKPRKEIEQRVKEMLELVQLGHLASRYPYQLSGGQQQRVALARALAIRPALLLLDEPLSALDAKVRAEVREEIRNIQTRLGITTIFVTHDQEEAMSISDRVVVMSQGHIEQVGTPADIYNYPTTEFTARFVGHLNLMHVDVISLPQGLVKIGATQVHSNQSLETTNGQQIRLAIRPEELVPGHVEGHNNLMGKITAITYLGPIVRLQLEVEGAQISMDMFNERKLQIPSVGTEYEISFHPDACWLL